MAPAPIRRMCVSVPRNTMAFMKSINFNENNNLSVGFNGMFEFEVGNMFEVISQLIFLAKIIDVFNLLLQSLTEALAS